MVTIEVLSKTNGIPDKKSSDKQREATDFYNLGKQSASIEMQRNFIDGKRMAADIYSSLVMSQAKNILNTVLTDVARLLAQVKVNNSMITEYLRQLTNGAFQPPPPLTPLAENPAQAAGLPTGLPSLDNLVGGVAPQMSPLGEMPGGTPSGAPPPPTQGAPGMPM